MARNPQRTPRVAVTLSPESMKLLEELSVALQRPKAGLVAELIDEALPALLTTVKALSVVKDQPREAQRLMNDFAAQASMELSQQLLALDASIDRRTVKGKRLKKGAADGAP